MKTLQLPLVALSLLLAVPAYAATPSTAKYEGSCAFDLASGKKTPTDCSVAWEDPSTHDTYCFTTDAHRTEFGKNAQVNIAKADAEYAKAKGLSAANDALADSQKKIADATEKANEASKQAQNAISAAQGLGQVPPSAVSH
jgi:hypothetical protein